MNRYGGRTGGRRGKGTPAGGRPRDHGRGAGPRDLEALEAWCAQFDGGPYAAYRDLRGSVRLAAGSMEIDRVQPDPFAGPSRIRFLLPWRAVGVDPGSIEPGGWGSAVAGVIDSASARAVGLRDFVGRWVGSWLADRSPRGSRGPAMWIVPHGQPVLDRSAVLFHRDHLEIRVQLDLPARGRRIRGREAAELLVHLPRALARDALAPGVFDQVSAGRHADVVEDFAVLQDVVTRNGWVAFVADGSRLPRRAGNDDRPLLGDEVVPFESPVSLRAEVVLPHAGQVSGMALEEGVSLICGGGFHGKSTVLRALGSSVVPHVPSDGREQVATRPDALSVRAEDGRAITRVDLRPFLDTLPFGREVDDFSTENASGSTSQAASILEALEGGSRLLLVDEDTSATNFMIRDETMAAFLEPHQEPIRSFVSQARALYEGLGVSSVLVIGGSGEPFRVADRVLVLDAYRPVERTADARALVADRRIAAATPADVSRLKASVERERPLPWGPAGAGRRAEGRDQRAGFGPRVRATGARTILVDRVPLELNALESMRDLSQARFLADVLAWRFRERTGGRELSRDGSRGNAGAANQPVADLRREFEGAWTRGGFDTFTGRADGDGAAVRFLDVLSAVNRLRSRPKPHLEWGIDGPEADV